MSFTRARGMVTAGDSSFNNKSRARNWSIDLVIFHYRKVYLFSVGSGCLHLSDAGFHVWVHRFMTEKIFIVDG